MVLTGIWIAGSNVTEPHPFVSVCVCVCLRALCILASQRGFTQYQPCQLEFCCSLSTQRATTPCAPSRAHTLSACDGSVGSPLNSPRKKSTKGGGSTFRQESTPLQPLWRLMTLVLVSVGVKKQVALRDSLHLLENCKIWRMDDTAPDYQISQMPAGEPVHVLYCKKKKKAQERQIQAKWRNAPLFICDT